MNRQFILFLLLVGVLAPSAVQARWWRAGSKAVQSARVPLQAAVRRGVIRPVPRVCSNFSVPAAAVERYVFKTVEPTPARSLSFVPEEPPYAWMRESADEYARVAEVFRSFKREADAFLYYQANSSECRVLHPEEVAGWRSRIDDMAAELDGLRFRVDADDPLLSFAREYLTYVRWTVYPQAKDIYFITPLPARTDRTFTPEEFFLQDPHPVSTRWELATARARRLSARLPAGLRVAVVNDFSFFRKRVTELHRQERLFADGTLRTYASADELLDAVLTRGERYDVIFTDIIIASGGGGYYLASELRQSGYNGVIIALSSYAPEEELGRKMFDRGLDGMISLEVGAEYKRGWPADLMQKLLNHYYYRDLHGWIR